MLFYDHPPGHPPLLLHLSSPATDTIGVFIDSLNDHPHPFAWTKDADQILGNIQRAKTNQSAFTHH